MVDEIGKKRSMLVPGSDDGRLRELDDIPLTDEDAPKVPDQSPAPISIEAMARYLRELTTTPPNSRGNAYPSKDAYAVVKTHQSDGTPTALVTPSEDAANVFAAATDREVVMSLAGQMFDSETIRKLRNPQTGLHEVLRTFISNTSGRNPEVATPDNAPEIQKKVSNVLRRNRFNPDPGRTPFLTLNTAASEIDKRPIGRGQSQLGSYDARLVDETTGITYEQMKKIGLALMLRATGEFIGKDGDPTSIANSTAALVPGSAQLLGTKIIDRKSMWAGDLSVEQGRPPDIGIREKSLSLDLTLDGGAQSYGNLNSHLEPFAGFAPIGMLTLGAALVVALRVLSEGFELVFSAASPPGMPSDSSVAPNPEGAIRTPGSSRYEPLSSTESIVGLFGFTPTKHNYSQAFDRGVDVFFGFDGVSDAAAGSKRLLESPGYYVVMIREIIRSGSRIIESIVDAFKSGPVGAIQGLLGLVDVIRGSKLVGYFNMVAKLGDILLLLEDEGLIRPDSIGLFAEPGNLPNNGKFSTIDRLVNNPASRAAKNRISENDSTLAWRTSATPSVYLLPAAIMNASDYMPTEAQLGLTTLTDVPKSLREKTITDASSARLSSDVVKEVESELDSEYVPFYFHDLRTNEIVSFHAFLAACTDSFSVSYDSGNYYGRVEPVRVYNKTERTINMTFNIVSTNMNDFDVMWWKINKLITMLYPQWSKGRKLIVKPGQDEFIQPFSQVPTSSPVIRLRLGDIFKSNYSKFTVARLFGLGTSDFVTNGVKTDPSRIQKIIKLNAAMADMKDMILQKPLIADEIEKFGYQPGYRAFFVPTQGELHLAPAGAANVLGSTAGALDRPVAIKSTGGEIGVTIQKVSGVVMGNKRLEIVYEVVVDAKHVPEGFVTGPYAVNFYQLRPNDDDIKERVLDQGIEDPGVITDTDIDEVQKFFSGENAIIRSFESVAGRGLAGVITSMAFDWKTPTWETASIGRRAPQWCQVTMTFLPIHDIAPGLDENGFNRAPVYNVGDTVGHVASDVRTDGKSEETFSRYHAEVAKNRKR